MLYQKLMQWKKWKNEKEHSKNKSCDMINIANNIYIIYIKEQNVI